LKPPKRLHAVTNGHDGFRSLGGKASDVAQQGRAFDWKNKTIIEKGGNENEVWEMVLARRNDIVE
jgi:hypothetical protein